MIKYVTRLALALIMATLLGSLSTPVLANDNPVDLELGGEGATSWDITGIMPGDSGTKRVTLRNAGSRNGFVTIWISDIVSSEGDNPESETGDTDGPGELDQYLLFDIDCSQLQTSISLPTTIDNLPQTVSDRLEVTPLNVGNTVTLDWQWELPVETGNEVQGDSLSFTINYMLEEFPPPPEEAPPTPPAPPAPPLGTTDVRGMVTTAGVFETSVTATSEDELCTLTIPEDTVGLTEELEPLDEITMVIMDEPPDPPEDAHVVGLAYDLGPDGATFEPAITLTFSYDPSDIPDGVAEEDLVLAYYDEETGEWVELDGVVDTENNTITASVAHFTTFAVITVPVVAPPAPAAFTVSSLAASPAQVAPVEAVTISVLVANTGGEDGSYQVTLVINDLVEATKEVTVRAGLSKEVTFTVIREEAGSYSISANGLSGSFTVVAPVIMVPPIPAFFAVSNLSILPTEVEPSEEVTVSVSVTNTGGTEGSYSVVLNINGVKEAEKSVTVAPDDSKAVTFTITREEAGSYTINVDGLSGAFEVKAPPEEVVVSPAKPGVNWPLIGGIIGGVIVVGLLIFFLVRRRRAH